MCQVKLSVCECYSRVYEAQLDHFEAMSRHLEMYSTEPFAIKSQFCWSPGSPCDGLRVCSSTKLGRCGRHGDGPGSFSRLVRALVQREDEERRRRTGPEPEREPPSAGAH